MSDWKTPLREYAAERGLEWWETELGVGVGFTDGCDVFWVLPGEAHSTVAYDPDADAGRDLIAEHRAIDQLRRQALHVLTFHLIDKELQVRRAPSGAWEALNATLDNYEFDVGESLTRDARDLGDLEAVIESLYRQVFVHMPSASEIDGYLAKPLPPESEWPNYDDAEFFDDDDEEDGAYDGGPDHAASESLQRVAGRFDAFRSLLNESSGGSQFAETLQRLQALLPDARAEGFDVATMGTVRVQYGDGWGALALDPRERGLARLMREAGPEGAAAELAERFRRTEARRARVLDAIWAAARARGWRREDVVVFSTTVYLGGTQREAQFSPDHGLNHALRHDTLDDALRELFHDCPDFAEACVAQLAAAAEERVELPPRGSLAPREPATDAVPLVELTPERVAALDQFAQRALESYLAQEGAKAYLQADRFDPASDTWCDMERWVALAEASEWPYYSIKIYLDAGDPRVEEAFVRCFKEIGPDDEPGLFDAELIWRFRRQHPEIAKLWLSEFCEERTFLQARARLGDPVAQRRAALQAQWEAEQYGDDADDDEWPSAAAASALPETDQVQVHQRLCHWARTNTECSPPDAEPLRLALELDWTDVADALQENPHLLVGLFTAERRPYQFDVPGLLNAADFVLAWSRLAPSVFLARVIATARETDLAERAIEREERSAAGRPDLVAMMGMTRSMIEQQAQALVAPLAIAWTRCRPHLAVDDA